MADEFTGMTLKITEADIRHFCEKYDIEPLEVHMTYRRLTTENSGITAPDCIYAMGQMKQMGLPALGEWLTPLPKKGGGFSLCVRKDASFYIVSHHPDIDITTLKVMFTTGAGKSFFVSGKKDDVPKGTYPSFSKLQEVDWGLSCTVQAELRGQVMEKTCPYKNWVATSQDGNPKFLWLKMAGEMLEKQTMKDRKSVV